MVKIVEETIEVDKQGRLVLPSRIRKSIGLKEKGKVAARIDGRRVILEPFSEDLERRVDEWRKLAVGARAKPFTEDLTESWKWMSLAYARRKLGLG